MWNCLLILCAQFAVAAALQGPVTNCSCTPTGTDLTVDCEQRSDINLEQLSAQLDSLLSSNLTYGRLTRLWIVNTPLTQVPRSVCQLTTLTELYLSNSRLTRLPDNCLTNLSNLVEFRAQNNVIETLQDGVFDGLTKLRRLDLSGNRIRSIGLSVFATASNLSSLFNIDLSHNELTSLEPWVYDRGLVGSSEKKVQIHLQHNMISKFTNRMGHHFQGHPGLCFIELAFADVDLRSNNIRHYADIWNGWQVDIQNVLHCYSNKKHSINLSIIIGGNDTACDCINYPFFKKRTRRYWPTAMCNVTDPLTKKSRIVNGLTADASLFACELTEGCPSKCVCVHRPANTTIYIYCSNQNLKVLPPALPELPDIRTKYKLDFSNNPLLHRLEHRDYFANTSMLDVSNCSIRVGDVSNWEEIAKISNVSFYGNKITALPESVISINFTSDTLNFGNNPWDCSCRNKWMSKWFRSIQNRLTTKVLCKSPSQLRHKSLAKITKEEFCNNAVSEAVTKSVTISLLTVAGVAFVLLFVGVIAYRLRVRLYTRWKLHPFDRDECLGEDMDYDVFLCCSYEDDDPHGLRILELIESNGCRVWYRERDLLAGQMELEGLTHAVEHSKRVVCLISTTFLRSNARMTEFVAAYHHNVAKKRKKRLIVLKMLERDADLFANDASDSAIVRHVLSQYRHIDFNADNWKEQLLYALPLRGLLDRADDSDGPDADGDAQLLRTI